MADDFVSKTRRKKQMIALQDLGEALVSLNSAQLEELPLSDDLWDAVLEAKRITKWGALRRQMQYIGRLMRDVDAAPIQDKLAAWQSSSREHAARLHRLERWRTRLLEDETALDAFVRENPGADSQRLRALVRNARHEAAAGKPPKSFRALFQALREAIPEAPSVPRGPENGPQN